MTIAHLYLIAVTLFVGQPLRYEPPDDVSVAQVHYVTTPQSYVVLQGQATYYNPRVMERVMATRRIDLHTACPECKWAVALLDRKHLLKKAWLKVDGVWYGPLLVTDCAGKENLAALERRGLAIEVEWNLAVVLGMDHTRSPIEDVTVYVEQ